MSNAQKTPFARSIDQFSAKKINDAFQVTGRALPASVVSVAGAIVTIKFEVESLFTLPQIEVPLFGPEYIRYPIQAGCKGVVFAADARLGAMSGLGGGVADLVQPANLGSLVFFPIGNKSWFSVDANVLVMYGPQGVTLMDIDGNSVINLTPSSITAIGKESVTLEAPGCSISLSGGEVNINGVLIINGQPYLAHTHSGVFPGGGTSGPVVP